MLPGNGDGTFRQPLKNPVTNGLSVVVADFNEDGKLDLAVGTNGPYFGSLNFSILTGKGDGTFNQAVSHLETTLLPASDSASLAVEDFNGDGHADLAVGGLGTQSGSLSVLAGNGDGTFRVLSSAPLGGSTLSLATADLNGDSQVDVVTASGLSHNVQLLLGAAPSALRWC